MHAHGLSPKLRASVDAAMHWYHSTIRAGCARLVFHKVLAAKLGVTPNEAYANEGRDLLAVALEQMEAYWLKGGKRPFMTGSQVSGEWPRRNVIRFPIATHGCLVNI